MTESAGLWRPTWVHHGIHLTEPITVPFTLGPHVPHLEASAALTEAGEAAVYVGMFDVGTKSWTTGLASLVEAEAAAAALLTQVETARQRWG